MHVARRENAPPRNWLPGTEAGLFWRDLRVKNTKMQEYRVIDLKTDTIDPDPRTVQADGPEQAAELVLGLQLVRSGARRYFRARVYFQVEGQPLCMVRLYEKVDDGHK